MHRRDLLALVGAFAAAPAMAQTPEPVPASVLLRTVRVDVETGQGKIVIELYVDRAPITTANFLRYVDQKRYDGATFFRASRAPGPADYGLIQGGLQGDPARVLKPIAHEPTTQTGIKHTDGVVSIARNAPGTATSDFFICVGDAAYLDADPAAPGDNAGFAAFGKVVEGMDVVRKIINLPTPGVAVNPVMKGQILEPPVPILSARRAAAL